MRQAVQVTYTRLNSLGFTIVELLIVIVIVGILTSIVIVSYSGVTRSAQTASMISELKQWEHLFEVYKTINGKYPAPSATPLTGGGPGTSALNGYCLGTGFPKTAGVGYCLVSIAGDTWSIAESTGTSLITQLSTVGTPPLNSKKYVYNTVVGPFLLYINTSDVRLYGSFPPNTACPAGTQDGFADASRHDCYVSLDYN